MSKASICWNFCWFRTKMTSMSKGKRTIRLLHPIRRFSLPIMVRFLWCHWHQPVLKNSVVLRWRRRSEIYYVKASNNWPLPRPMLKQLQVIQLLSDTFLQDVPRQLPEHKKVGLTYWPHQSSQGSCWHPRVDRETATPFMQKWLLINSLYREGSSRL